jgi:hypothetical protein
MDSSSSGGADGAPTSDTGPHSPDAPLVIEAAVDAWNEGDVGAADATADGPAPTCRDIGCSCYSQSSCDSGICADSLTLTQDFLTANQNSFTCTQPCCTSVDCPLGTVCFGTGHGGSYCVLPALLGRTRDLGNGIGGALCSGDSDCRSGICTGTPPQCADTCCSSGVQGSECAFGTMCRFAPFPGKTFDVHATGWCGGAIGGGPIGQFCGTDAACQTGKCSALARCLAVCRTTSDCPVGQSCTYQGGPTPPTTGDIVPTCNPTVTGGMADGMPCNASSDCLSAFCAPTKVCTDICFANSDCKNAWRCAPLQVQVTISSGSYSILSCQP